jgi:predicted kinase
MDAAEEKVLIESLAQPARSDRLMLFVGAGASAAYGLPTWGELIGMLGTRSPNAHDLPGEFSKYVEKYGILALHHFLEATLGLRPVVVKDITALLLQIRSVAIVTTNCDRVLETAAHHLGVPLRLFVDDSDLEDFHTTPCMRLIKLHGTLDRKESLVFTAQDYANYPARIPALRAKVVELMRYCKVLFVGFSMADPDFCELLAAAAEGGAHHMTQMVGMFSKREIDENWRQLYLGRQIRNLAPLRELAFEEWGETADVGTPSFLCKLRDLISPPQLPSLSRQCLIFTNGYTATLKTELTSYLADCLGIPLVATHRYGRCTSGGILDSAKRNERYIRVFQDAAGHLGRRSSVVLDGTFAESQWREAVYRSAEEYGARVIVIKTRCEDQDYIRARLWRRRLDHSRSDHEVTDFRNFQITHDSIEREPVESDPHFKSLGVEVITFENHGNRRVFCADAASSDAALVAELVRISPLMSPNI